MNYNYLEAMVEDITEWMEYNNFDLSEYSDLDEAREYLYDELWAEDDVTGNGETGYGTRVDYENYLSHNWDALIDAIDNFYIDTNDIINLLEKHDVVAILKYCDTLIRLNTLNMAIDTALDDWINKERENA